MVIQAVGIRDLSGNNPAASKPKTITVIDGLFESSATGVSPSAFCVGSYSLFLSFSSTGSVTLEQYDGVDFLPVKLSDGTTSAVFTEDTAITVDTGIHGGTLRFNCTANAGTIRYKIGN